jgi:hypothetical protein
MRICDIIVKCVSSGNYFQKKRKGWMNKQDINDIISQLEKENSFFTKKASLDSLSLPSKILGRKNRQNSYIRFLLDYKQEYAVPYILISLKALLYDFIRYQAKDHTKVMRKITNISVENLITLY